MSFASLLIDECTILTRTVDRSGMTDTESWVAQAEPTKCRLFKASATSYNAEKAQHATMIKTRFALPVSAILSIRDRIQHEERSYDVMEVIEPFNRTRKHHKIAVCEIIAGDV